MTHKNQVTVTKENVQNGHFNRALIPRIRVFLMLEQLDYRTYLDMNVGG